ncbi:hypothetical protein PFLUV_G00200710 [Perca fluviatilis]|uniref:Uncharacterized protein n=1 Tax=Perca fluviatilis TaxID=8168 RepID=A0A6A5EEY7_PERFL|nr:hypothetical protein PFLUV_G00200710 [Perca fluviatilis]
MFLPFTALLHRNESTPSALAHTHHHSSLGISPPPPSLVSCERRNQQAAPGSRSLPRLSRQSDFSSLRLDGDSSARRSHFSDCARIFASLEFYILAAVTDYPQLANTVLNPACSDTVTQDRHSG